VNARHSTHAALELVDGPFRRMGEVVDVGVS
jgi:hypothetical protein